MSLFPSLGGAVARGRSPFFQLADSTD
jgi:hypothetical protein